jgi:asparagine synthase (glutamine-hydrolysing)
MPGIVGVVSLGKREDLGTCLENMISPMMHRDWYRVKRKVTLDMGLASISVDNEETISEGNSLLLAVTGEIVDQEKLRAKLLDIGDKDTFQYSLPDILLRLYLRFGIEALRGLNGIYVVVVWEDKQKKLTIINDRCGFGKLYYWFTNDRLMFAPECKSIIWHPEFNKKVSELALADFMSIGYFLDDRTLFEGIKLVPPASIMTYQAGKLSFHHYWDYEFYTAGGETLSEDHYVDEYALRLEEAVSKRVKENTCLPITGGLDSRALAGVLDQCARGLKVRTNTIGHKHCYDVRFGRKIAQSLGYEHTFIPVGPTYMAEYSNEGVWRLEGAASCYTSWIFPEDTFLEENNIDFVMSGFLGDCLSGAHLPIELLEETNEERAVRSLYTSFYNKVFRDDELARFLKPNVYRNIEGESFNSIRRCFNITNTDNILNKCDYVDLHQRQRRYIALHLDILGAFSRVLDPFADNEFVDFILRVPLEMRVGQRIYKKMIVKHLPKVARIPYTASGLPLNAAGIKYRTYRLWNDFYIPKLLRRILRKITFNKLGYHHFQSYVHYNEWLRTGSRDFVMDVLNQKEYLEDYFNMDMVNNLVIDHIEGRRRVGEKICALVTFSLFRKQFCQ